MTEKGGAVLAAASAASILPPILTAWVCLGNEAFPRFSRCHATDARFDMTRSRSYTEVQQRASSSSGQTALSPSRRTGSYPLKTVA